ncbi:MMPL family transporter [Ferroacidibacillus organovorans]|uniref:SSD domain-containing protein n=1 Tax=Ferroacidibacillus organovorans TaxID=1765683 RepID=A0A117SYA0_9BACL|nr:MMPL family transporter [Ferroacidibacillus organovorans]KUO96618.1 hypothetical protein ATW55_00630 [Ferroacidibacillus organovorans]
MRSYASWIYKLRFLIIILWIVGAVLSVKVLPNLNSVVAHHSTPFLPSTAESQVASRLAGTMQGKHPYKSSAIVVLVNPNGLTQGDKQYLNDQLAVIKRDEAKYGVDTIQSAAQTPQGASSFFSKNKTTEIAFLGMAQSDTTKAAQTGYENMQTLFAHPPQGAHVSLTGATPITVDNMTISMNGVSKSGGVTVALILVILFLVFRSIIAPIVTLLTIGVSFLITSGIVAKLALHGFPVSTFTQTFLIAILFGAGTDYSIVMLNRFREEMTQDHPDVLAAMTAAMRGVSKTILFSAATVFVSFAVLYFANFGLYRSAVGVSIGVFFAILACMTLIPSIMGIFGRTLFWPRRPVVGAAHKPSAIWSFSGRIATRHPWWTILLSIVLLAPIAAQFTNLRSFNSLEEIPQAPSVKGFHEVANAFGIGRVMPVQVILQSPSNLRSSQGLATIEQISQALSHAPLVSQVDSATRPTGTLLRAFELAHQNGQIAQGVTKINTGLGQLSNGLTQAAVKLRQGVSDQSRLVTGAQNLARGLAQYHQGVSQFSTHLPTLATGANALATGAARLGSGLSRLQAGITQEGAGVSQVTSGLAKLAPGTAQVASGLQSLQSSSAKFSALSAQMNQALAAWLKAHPSANDASMQQILGMSGALAQGLSQTASGTAQLASGASALHAATGRLAAGAGPLSQGMQALATASGKLSAGASSLHQGGTALANGAQQLATGAAQLAHTSGQLATGASQVASGVAQSAAGTSQLQNGLAKAASGATQLHSGLSSANQALHQSQNAAQSGNPGFYVPASVVAKNASLQKAMNAYISPNGHIAQFTVDLTVNPYSAAALSDVAKLRNVAQVALAASPLHSGQIYMGGTSAGQEDLNQISNADFLRTVSLIFLAIFVLLAIMLRSLLAPLYILVSLIASYFVTMGVMQVVFVSVLHYTGIDWTVPFFSLLLLVALGVDYSIFLMARFDEMLKEGLAPRTAIRLAMQRMGGVVFAAAIIMAGTFGSMTVAGVTALLEIGSSVVLGLFIYTGLLLGFFVPSAVSVVDRAHHWPFFTRDETENEVDGRRARASDGALMVD